MTLAISSISLSLFLTFLTSLLNSLTFLPISFFFLLPKTRLLADRHLFSTNYRVTWAVAEAVDNHALINFSCSRGWIAGEYDHWREESWDKNNRRTEDGASSVSDRKVIGSCLRFNRIVAMASRKLSAHGATSRGDSKLNISLSFPPFHFSLSPCVSNVALANVSPLGVYGFLSVSRRRGASIFCLVHSISSDKSPNTQKMFKTFYFSARLFSSRRSRTSSWLLSTLRSLSNEGKCSFDRLEKHTVTLEF